MLLAGFPKKGTRQWQDRSRSLFYIHPNKVKSHKPGSPLLDLITGSFYAGL